MIPPSEEFRILGQWGRPVYEKSREVDDKTIYNILYYIVSYYISYSYDVLWYTSHNIVSYAINVL